MRYFYNFTLLLMSLGLTTSLFAQPDCVDLISPIDGATDTDLTVILQWAPAGTGETPVSYDLYWGSSPGNLFLLEDDIVANTVPVTATAINTTYYWRVEANGPSGTTMGCAEYSYTTLGFPEAPIIDCTNATPIDIAFDLESTTGWTGDIATSGTGFGLWKFNTGQTPTSNTGPSQGQSGVAAQYAHWEASNGMADASFISPSVDLTEAAGDIAFEFYMHAYGSGINKLDVSIGVSPTGPWTSIYDWTGQFQTSRFDPWQKIGLNLADYAGEIIYINFTNEITPNNGAFGDMSIDDISISACTAITAPNNDCASATVLASSGNPGMLANETTTGATDSGIGSPTCEPSTRGDVYYSIETDIDGGGLSVELTAGAGSRMVMTLYGSSCGSLTELDCAAATTNGEAVNIEYFVPNNLQGNGNNNRSAPQNFILRVYDLNDTGEAFGLDASGTSLASLPVDLTSFNAQLKRESVNLTWRTASEENTERFDIEKSYDGTNWEVIGQVNAVGFSTKEQEYDFEDSNLRPVQYYRLHIIDFNGYEDISKVILIKRDDLQINISPNPASDYFTLDGYEFLADSQNLSIYSIDGRKVIDTEVGNNQVFDVSQLKTGTYTVKVTDGYHVYVMKLIKK